MGTPATDRARLARILFPTGIALLFIGAAVGAFVEPWWAGALIAAMGAADLGLALVFSRASGGDR